MIGSIGDKSMAWVRLGRAHGGNMEDCDVREWGWVGRDGKWQEKRNNARDATVCFEYGAGMGTLLLTD